MPQIAFSTVACPGWALPRVAASVRRLGFDGVELRTFGSGSTELACDPALTDPTKVRTLFASQAVPVVSLGTSLRYDEPVRKMFFGAPVPPGTPHAVADAMGDFDAPVRLTKPFVHLAREIGGPATSPVVRVFGFARSGSFRRTVQRVADRLKLVADDARHTGVRIAVENGGAFPGAEALLTLLDAVDNSLVGACYAPHAAPEGTDACRAVELFGDSLFLARVKSTVRGEPCPLGAGDTDSEGYVRALAGLGSACPPIVYEWDRLWLPHLADAEEALPAAAQQLCSWLTPDAPSAPAPAGAA